MYPGRTTGVHLDALSEASSPPAPHGHRERAVLLGVLVPRSIDRDERARELERTLRRRARLLERDALRRLSFELAPPTRRRRVEPNRFHARGRSRSWSEGAGATALEAARDDENERQARAAEGREDERPARCEPHSGRLPEAP